MLPQICPGFPSTCRPRSPRVWHWGKSNLRCSSIFAPVIEAPVRVTTETTMTTVANTMVAGLLAVQLYRAERVYDHWGCSGFAMQFNQLGNESTVGGTKHALHKLQQNLCMICMAIIDHHWPVMIKHSSIPPTKTKPALPMANGTAITAEGAAKVKTVIPACIHSMRTSCLAGVSNQSSVRY